MQYTDKGYDTYLYKANPFSSIPVLYRRLQWMTLPVKSFINVVFLCYTKMFKIDGILKVLLLCRKVHFELKPLNIDKG